MSPTTRLDTGPEDPLDVFRNFARQLTQHFFGPSPPVLDVVSLRETLHTTLSQICPNTDINDDLLASILCPNPHHEMVYHPADIMVNLFMFCATQMSGTERPSMDSQHTVSNIDDSEPEYHYSGSQEAMGRRTGRRRGSNRRHSGTHIFFCLHIHLFHRAYDYLS